MSKLKIKLEPNQVLDKYTLISKLGEGSQGETWKAVDNNNNNNIALKIGLSNGPLFNEACIRMNVDGWYYEQKKTNLICHQIEQEGVNDDYKWIPLELMDGSLDNLSSKNKLSTDYILNIGKYLLEGLRYIHSKGFIFRDVSLGNILYTFNPPRFCWNDFGVSIQYEYSKNVRKFTGTAKFASNANLSNLNPSYWDDLESLGYLLIYLINGKLPWSDIKANTKTLKGSLEYAKQRDITPALTNPNMYNYIKYIFSKDRNIPPTEQDYNNLINYL